MRLLFIATLVSASYCCGPVFAQVGMGMSTPSLSATSPLGSDPGTPVGGTGIPMGAAVPSSPVVSSLPSYPTGASSTACSTQGTPPAAMYGSPSSYDGGGVTLNGTATPATASTVATATSDTKATSGISATSGLSVTSGMATTAGSSGICGSGSSGVASSSTPTSTSPTTTSARAGIPLDSTEIGNLGVSSSAAVPTTSRSTASSMTTSTVP
jgi:hypothetical protein